MLAGLFSVFSLVLKLVCYLVIKALVVLRIVSSIYRSFPLWGGGSALQSTSRKPKGRTQGTAAVPNVGKSILRASWLPKHNPPLK